MKKKPEVIFRNIDHSPAIEDAVRQRIDKIAERFADLIGCTVTIDAPHRHSHKGHIYSVTIDLTVPGSELVISRDPQKDHAHEDVYVAVRDAFDAGERRLKKHFAKQRSQDVKVHETHPHGRVDRLFEGEGYGFISTLDGRHIYFHQNAVADDAWESLEVGDAVEFSETAGEEGPQASMVRKLGS